MSGGNNKNIRNDNKRPSHMKQLGNDNDRLLQFLASLLPFTHHEHLDSILILFLTKHTSVFVS